MGYACPVCSDPQADRGHLANHLAFTAMLGDDDHEAWLEEHAPGWETMGEAELADVVAELVEETSFPQLFEDTAGGLDEGSPEPRSERSGALFEDGSHGGSAGHDHTGHGHSGDAPTGHSHDDHGTPTPGRGAVDTSGPLDDEAAAVVEKAREMTEEMLTAPDGDDGSDRAEDIGANGTVGSDRNAESDRNTESNTDGDGADDDR